MIDGLLRLEDNGLATVSWADEYGKHIYQAIYFFVGNDGMALYERETTYYTDDYTLRTRGRVSTSVAEDVDLEVLTDEQVEDLSEVLSREEFNGFVSGVIVGGHADTSGSYESNQILSEERANEVMSYCLSEECGLSDTERSSLEAIMQAKAIPTASPSSLWTAAWIWMPPAAFPSPS